jgi:hypothetical protein
MYQNLLLNKNEREVVDCSGTVSASKDTKNVPISEIILIISVVKAH